MFPLRKHKRGADSLRNLRRRLKAPVPVKVVRTPKRTSYERQMMKQKFYRVTDFAVMESNDTDSIKVASSTSVVVTTTNAMLQIQLPTTAGYHYATFGCHFVLDGLPSPSEFNSLYDQYRIRKISVALYPEASGTLQQSSDAGTASWSCFIHSILDKDDNNAPTADASGIQTMFHDATYRIHNVNNHGGRVFKRTFKPLALGPARDDDQGATAEALFAPTQWMNMAYGNIPYHGLKFIVEIHKIAGSVAPYIGFRPIVKYWLECKQVR